MGSTTVLEMPPRTGNRDAAREFVASLPTDLTDKTVVLNGKRLVASASSHMDELIKVILEERKAVRLTIVGATEIANEFARSSASRRGVAQRLEILAD